MNRITDDGVEEDRVADVLPWPSRSVEASEAARLSPLAEILQDMGGLVAVLPPFPFGEGATCRGAAADCALPVASEGMLERECSLKCERRSQRSGGEPDAGESCTSIPAGRALRIVQPARTYVYPFPVDPLDQRHGDPSPDGEDVTMGGPSHAV